MGGLENVIGVLIEHGGLTGLVVAVVAAVMIWQSQQHRAERKEWREEAREDGARSHELQDETNRVLRELSAVISSANRR